MTNMQLHLIISIGVAIALAVIFAIIVVVLLLVNRKFGIHTEDALDKFFCMMLGSYALAIVLAVLLGITACF